MKYRTYERILDFVKCINCGGSGILNWRDGRDAWKSPCTYCNNGFCYGTRLTERLLDKDGIELRKSLLNEHNRP